MTQKTLPEERHRKLRKPGEVDLEAVRLLGMADRNEIPLKSALQQLGISVAQSTKGWKLVQHRRNLRDALAVARAEELHHYHADVVETTAQMDVNLINWRLRNNLKRGEDKAVQSAKVLGSRKDLNMWQPEVVNGVIIMQAPPTLDLLDDGIAESQHQWDGTGYAKKSVLSPPRTLEADTETEEQCDNDTAPKN